MRIVCPSCAAAYEVSDALIRSRRSVRCAKCSTEWRPDPVDTSPLPEATDLRQAISSEAPESAQLSEPSLSLAGTRPAPLAQTEPPRHAASASGSTGCTKSRVGHLFGGADIQAPLVWTAWAVSIAALLLFCWAAYEWRAEVMQIWPPSQRLYAALGLRSTLE
jgi:predicted Zn finger-like uncharacterized protein